jgi:hypothetical protein
MRGEGSYTRVSRFLRYVGGAALSTALIAGFAAPSANAQGWRDHDRDRDYNSDINLPGRDVRQVATVNGYSDGFEHGLMDRRNRDRFDYQHSDDYRSANAGYNSSWGNPREYQSSYRQGYGQGYSDAFYGRARNQVYDRDRLRPRGMNPYDAYSSYPGYTSSAPASYDDREGDRDRDDVARAAAQNGYSSGYERGQYDAQQRNRPNPQGHGAYQFGFDGFDASWGSASTYQSSYRQYFVQGYNDGFNNRDRDSRYFRRF